LTRQLEAKSLPISWNTGLFAASEKWEEMRDEAGSSYLFFNPAEQWIIEQRVNQRYYIQDSKPLFYLKLMQRLEYY